MEFIRSHAIYIADKEPVEEIIIFMVSSVFLLSGYTIYYVFTTNINVQLCYTDSWTCIPVIHKIWRMYISSTQKLSLYLKNTWDCVIMDLNYAIQLNIIKVDPNNNRRGKYVQDISN